MVSVSDLTVTDSGRPYAATVDGRPAVTHYYVAARAGTTLAHTYVWAHRGGIAGAQWPDTVGRVLGVKWLDRDAADRVVAAVLTRGEGGLTDTTP